ncbi:DNA internalization-related competence protein ComEC/Rec2 [Sporomusa sp.]|uniref:DNA internalization-related competence protein ComEC/Rec2 n=1 Tax=Sporomusa sp. TaxID=2078658 RepID=UPI002CBC273B|nr:DNA internalization-related competence protein ComEC/Rec2 [Sporomusa sp.]HWR42773.1 DNA internalization-related competence protein ComEC/Rec2 [Sporomusa sp.]
MEKLNNILVFTCASFAAGIWQAGLYNWNISILTALAILLLLTAVWRVNTNCHRVFWPLIGLFFIAGMIYYTQDRIVRTDDISHYIGQAVAVEGTVDAVPEVIETEPQNWQVRYVVRVEKVKADHLESFVQASGKVRISAQYKEQKFKPAAYGDKIAVNGKVLELHGYNNPGQIDMTAAFKRQNITARMSAQGQTIKIITVDNTYSWRVALANWQQGIVNALQKVMPVNDAAILTTVLFGGYQGINKNVIDDFATTGLIHILSVSGAHIALVAGLIRWLGSRLGLGSLATITLAALVVVLYAVISGLTPPVIRSAVMGLISLMAVVLGRENYAPAALSITALGMLVYQPLLLYDISFQLSFGATAGLVFLYQRTLNWMSRLPSWLAGPLAVTVSAQLGVLPLIAWYFNNFPIISVVANIIVLPIVELVIILGLAGVVIYTAVPGIGNIVFVISSLLIGFVMMCTALLASLPYSSAYIPSVGLTGSAGYYLMLAWVYGWRPFHMRGPRQLFEQCPRLCALTAILVVGVIVVYTWYPRPLAVHFIDVGQGDATLVVTPHGKAVLVDTGGSFGGSNFDIGERVVAPYLKHYGVTAVDYLILTHGHQDHAGGAAGVAGDIRIIKVMLAREEYSQAVQALLHIKPAVAIIPVYTGQTFQLDDVLFSVDHAVGDGEASSQAASGNEVSSVIRVSYGQHSFLLTGDLEAQGEAAMLAQGVLPCTVLKVGHHGSKTSSTAPFLQAISPRFAVISVGYGNRFGHPHPETLKRLAEIKTLIYRTDRQGAIVFKSDGKNIEVDTYLNNN